MLLFAGLVAGTCGDSECDIRRETPLITAGRGTGHTPVLKVISRSQLGTIGARAVR